MSNVHVSAVITKDLTFSKEKVPEQLLSCADELEKIAKDYREMAEFLKKKHISISEVNGEAHSGTFTVDEIDTGRLQKAKLLSDNPSATFFIDPKFDALLEEQLKKLKESYESDELDSHGFITDEDIADTKELLQPEEENSKDDLIIDIDDVTDAAPIEVKFDKDSSQFSFLCRYCDETHVEELSNVYKSLYTAISLVNGLLNVASNDETTELVKLVVDDLTLLKALLEQEFGIEKIEEDSEDFDD